MAQVAMRRGHHTDLVAGRNMIVRALVSAAIFAASIGIAAIPNDGEALAKYFWLLHIPARLIMHQVAKRSRSAKAVVQTPGDRQ
jgi:hypothetical protein